MKIILTPQRREATLEVIKSGNSLVVNGELFDFSRMVDGDILPSSAISSEWFFDNVSNIGGDLELTLLLPIPWNYSQEQAFPVPLQNVPDGNVIFPQPLNEQQTQEKLAAVQHLLNITDAVQQYTESD